MAAIIINAIVGWRAGWVQDAVINMVTQTCAILTTLLLGFYDLITIRSRMYGWMVKASFIVSKLKETKNYCEQSRIVYCECQNV